VEGGGQLAHRLSTRVETKINFRKKEWISFNFSQNSLQKSTNFAIGKIGFLAKKQNVCFCKIYISFCKIQNFGCL
jgi:hypothetical protein